MNMYSLNQAEKDIQMLNEEIKELKKKLEDMTPPEEMRYFIDKWKQSDEYKNMFKK